MPLYFFDIRWNGRRLNGKPDEGGLWFPNLRQAEREAREVAEEIRTKLGIGRVVIRIRDQHERIQEIVESS